MKQLFSFLLICCFIIVRAYSQESFQVSYPSGDQVWGTQIDTLNNGSFVLSSYTDKSAPAEMFLMHLNQNGDTLWTRKVDGDLGQTYYSVVAASTGGYLLVGDSEIGTSVNAIRLDNNANLIWTKNYTGFHNGTNFIKAIESDDGGFVFSSSYPPRMSLTKINASGYIEWHKSYTGSGFSTLGGINPRSAVQQAKDGGYVLVSNLVSYSLSNASAAIFKLNSLGDVEWSYVLGGVNGDLFKDVIQTSDDGFVAVGYTESFGVGYEDVLMVKFDVNGSLLWSKTYGTPTRDYPYAVDEYKGGGLIVSGMSGQAYGGPELKPILLKTDAHGNSVWSRQVDDSGSIFDQILTPDGGIVLVGSKPYANTNDWDILLIKSDSVGYMGCNTVDLSLTEMNQTLTLDTAYTVSTPSVNVQNITMTITGTSLQVNHICDSVFNCSLDTSIFMAESHTLTSNAINVAYQWIECPSMEPIAGATDQSYHINKNGNYAVIVDNGFCSDTSSCFSVTDVGINEGGLNRKLLLYPNPTTGKIQINLGTGSNEVTIHLYNIVGELVQVESRTANGFIAYDMPKEKGVYFLQLVYSDGKFYSLKVVNE